MIVVYADESGTGGIPKSGKEPAPGVCGFLATPEMWNTFQLDWKRALADHKAPYFHFRELDRNQRKKDECRFYGWSDDSVDDFIYDMALVASSGPVAFGGNVSVKREYGNSPTKKDLLKVYRKTFEQFFDDFGVQMNMHFPNERGTVSFFFDDNESEDWIAILDGVIKEKRKMDPRIGEYTPVDDTTEGGIPCQAADLLAYVNRQNNETIYELDAYVPQRILDIMLARYAFPEWHPFAVLRKMKEPEWRNLVSELRARKKQFDLLHELAGTKPKPHYYPIVEHPYFGYLCQLCYEHKRKYPKLWA